MSKQQANVLNSNVIPVHQSMNNDDEIDLRELFSVIWKGKWLILLITFVFAVGSVVFALSKPNIYKSSVLLAPAEEESKKMGALASQFGGLASIAGINLGGGSSNSTALAIATLKSRKFLTNFVNQHDLKIPLFAAESWDLKSGELTLNSELYDVNNKAWLVDVETGETLEPTDWRFIN